MPTHPNHEPTISTVEPAFQGDLDQSIDNEAVPIPEQLVSETLDLDDQDEVIASTGADAESASPLAASTTTRLAESIQMQGFEVVDLGQGVSFNLPAGRSSRVVRIPPSLLSNALTQDFTGWRSLERFDGIWHQETGKIEVLLSSDRFGLSLQRILFPRGTSASAADPEGESAILLDDPSTGIRIDIGAASGLITTLSTRGWRTQGLLSLSIRSLELMSTAEADDVIEGITDALSLELAIRKDISLFPRRLEDRRLLRTRRPRAGGNLSFPKSSYAHAPVILYRAGRDRATSPLLRYWAFYQVLEFFFPKYVRSGYVQHLARVLRDPTFDPHDEMHILRVASLIQDGAGGRLSEEQQLLTTLRAIITEVELTEFINEAGMSDWLSDKKGRLSNVAINLTGEEVISQVGRRIYDIRCKIVHSKGDSTMGSNGGLLPGTPDDDLARYELPLIEFLAEEALKSSAERLVLPFRRHSMEE